MQESPYQHVGKAFTDVWDCNLPMDDLGKLLNILSINLGVVLAELTRRGVHWEVLDRNVVKSVLRGVDQTAKSKRAAA